MSGLKHLMLYLLRQQIFSVVVHSVATEFIQFKNTRAANSSFAPWLTPSLGLKQLFLALCVWEAMHTGILTVRSPCCPSLCASCTLLTSNHHHEHKNPNQKRKCPAHGWPNLHCVGWESDSSVFGVCVSVREKESVCECECVFSSLWNSPAFLCQNACDSDAAFSASKVSHPL